MAAESDWRGIIAETTAIDTFIMTFFFSWSCYVTRFVERSSQLVYVVIRIDLDL